MPVILTFDIEGAEPVEHNRIQSFFERLGWESLGGTAYRYPRLGADQPVEDWFNHVLPALMLFRAFLIRSGRPLSRFTLDVQSSVGLNPDRTFGTPPLGATQVPLYTPTNPQFGVGKLQEWLDGIGFPY